MVFGERDTNIKHFDLYTCTGRETGQSATSSLQFHIHLGFRVKAYADPEIFTGYIIYTKYKMLKQGLSEIISLIVGIRLVDIIEGTWPSATNAKGRDSSFLKYPSGYPTAFFAGPHNKVSTGLRYF